jgi:hypothetical protein
MKKIHLLAAALFLAGCLVGGASSSFGVPPAHGQWQERVRGYEHFCFPEYLDADHVRSKLDQAGKNGFELATVTATATSGMSLYCMKRPIY